MKILRKTEIEHIKGNSDSLTATSSFAAISTNDSTSDSKYEHIGDAYETLQHESGNVENEARSGMDGDDYAMEISLTPHQFGLQFGSHSG